MVSMKGFSCDAHYFKLKPSTSAWKDCCIGRSEQRAFLGQEGGGVRTPTEKRVHT